MNDQLGKAALSLLLERLEFTCEMVCLLSKTVIVWTRDSLAVDAQTCAGVESFLVLFRCCTCVVSTSKTGDLKVH